IDSHTHLVFAGNRAGEFEQRLNGVPYQTIAAQGGGILSTVKATRAASEATLLELAVPRANALIRDGVTTIEIKSGYGLTLEDELKMLRV
ncbi:imidazolonepropionase, partial [Streptococcus pyogenes]